jgi:hypothetical protein
MVTFIDCKIFAPSSYFDLGEFKFKLTPPRCAQRLPSSSPTSNNLHPSNILARGYNLPCLSSFPPSFPSPSSMSAFYGISLHLHLLLSLHYVFMYISINLTYSTLSSNAKPTCSSPNISRNTVLRNKYDLGLSRNKLVQVTSHYEPSTQISSGVFSRFVI